MGNSRIKVVVLFGGQSGEHEVSLNSAESVLQAIDYSRYEVETIGISKEGQWFWGITPSEWIKNKSTSKSTQVTLIHDPGNPRFLALDGTSLPDDGRFNLIFPVLHGPLGEDGTIQGLFEVANVPYVGSGVLGSSLGMDKDRMKAVFAYAGLSQAPYLTFLRSEFKLNATKILATIETKLGYPCFIKPANLGSSVGISKAKNRSELIDALSVASTFDRKIVVEQNISGREIEVSVLGNDTPRASIAGEILPAHEFYDYDAKYLDTGSRLVIPAVLDDHILNTLQDMAIKAFKAVEAAGLSRVDFFLTADNKVFINEINTLPGFTKISMYPKLWEASGISYSELIDQLIQLGLERHRDSKDRKISRT
ncbi:MAG: D-alanine--D-alanine ligase [Desulfitobacterium hafniense]|nr:D-alanine--D-alanine ligase [Desulfitobacterium hafniense]